MSTLNKFHFYLRCAMGWSAVLVGARILLLQRVNRASGKFYGDAFAKFL